MASKEIDLAWLLPGQVHYLGANGAQLGPNHSQAHKTVSSGQKNLGIVENLQRITSLAFGFFNVFFNFYFSGVDRFSGIYGALPKHCFVSPTEIIFSTPVVYTSHPVVVDIITGNVSVIDDASHLDVGFVSDGTVVGTKSSTTLTPRIVIAKFDPKAKALKPVVESPHEIVDKPGTFSRSFVHTPKEGHPDPSFASVKFTSVFTGPESAPNRSVPLILWPHGGPHSLTPDTFYREVDFFNRLGFGVLFVNFRGSLGAGQDSVDSLLGHVGDTDVKDCFQAMNECLQVSLVA